VPKPHAPYSAEFRRRLLDLVRTGRTPESLSREFHVSAQSIRNWGRQADLDAGRRSDGLTTEERNELIRLRRENRVLREEREILKKAAAWFAKENTSSPRKGSDS
jgi:transposase